MSEIDTPKEVMVIAKTETQRKAVEEVVGVFIKSHLLASNSQITEDLVYASVRGKINKVDIIKEGWDEKDNYAETNKIYEFTPSHSPKHLKAMFIPYFKASPRPDDLALVIGIENYQGLPKRGEAYIVPCDGDPNYLEVTGYSLKRLYNKLTKLHFAEVCVVLDSSFSGIGGRSVLAKGTRPLVIISGIPKYSKIRLLFVPLKVIKEILIFLQ